MWINRHDPGKAIALEAESIAFRNINLNVIDPVLRDLAQDDARDADRIA